MGVYANTDIHTTDEGDIVIANDGDIRIADPARSLRQNVMFLAMTNKGDLSFSPAYGNTLSRYIGERNSEQNRSFMERDLYADIRTNSMVVPEDASIDIVPLDVDKVTIIMDIKGSFVNTDATGSYVRFLQDNTADQLLAFIYPFTDGTITPVT